MKYLTPEIAALSKNFETTNSLVKRGVSCGIFQDCGEEGGRFSNSTKSSRAYYEE